MTKQIAGCYVNDNFGYGKDIIKYNNKDRLYKTAINNINNHFIMVGIMEKFDKSIALLKNKIGGKDILYHYYKKNINKNKKQGSKYSVSGDIRDKIAQYNDLDIKVYNYCKDRFYQSIKKIYIGNHYNYKISNPILKIILDLYSKVKRLL